ncbi:MAG: hypothetical protein JSS49_22120 [Planctomycetes bacterium]|nr:hypothetical protein [Planctomycetota bacterium]
MTKEPAPDRDDARLPALLRSIETDAPAPDAAVLHSLRERAAAEFERSVHPVAPANVSSQIPQVRRSPLLTFAFRGSLALVAAVAAVAVWLGSTVSPSVAEGTPFSVVLEELRGASTLHLQLHQAGQTSEILVRAPGLVRKQETAQRYQIAAGSRLWKVDEVQNSVLEGDSPWFLSSDRQVDLLGLMEVGVTDATPLLVARPHQRTRLDGRECYEYKVDLPAQRGRLRIQAFVDVATNQLVQITARDVVAADSQPPLADLRLIALNPPVADEEFVVAKSLTEDGRIGKISQTQGIVVLRPMLAQRWTPVGRDTLLRPGDWLRTELRGANAVKVTLSSDVELTVGPGSLLECTSSSQARLHSGQVQVQTTASDKVGPGTGFTLLAPRAGERVFKASKKQLVRVDRAEKLVDVPQVPVWLAGFEGTTNNESLGALIVTLPDGRNEPLSVGYHKVSVEIRDQIARTTIEESFVNHTTSRLEGVFHFPLPSDASISGFGMWIGDDLIEADVVEKQRAREIFETILREKRDPGLLEWMGGNLFKARVFPIEAHSEKRIKIVYTQVLPLRANRYRYSYGLRSELLRTKPLRELSLSVTVNSALPLKSITCPTHPVRTQQTGHSAQVDFAAQEYVPTRDFEVVCEVAGKQSDVVMIPHRRGDDGYFLVQLTPPSPEGNWQRELLPDGKPLHVVLMCDTSASMDSEKRQQQAEFVGTVLTSLGADDRFQVACVDVGTDWANAEPLAPTIDNIGTARAFLESRISLGWTNLSRAFADVIQRSPADAHVIYVGDGIVSAGSTDPAAFVQQLRLLIQPGGAKPVTDSQNTRRSFHSVSVGNSHESVVLQGIAVAGNGSTRAITNEQSPQIVALELLNEIAQPGLRDLNVEFRGLKVAAVYPDRLPNLAVGTQQILVGRYLPEGKDQSGEIVVTGLRGSEKVRYVARVQFTDAEAGNSFIPRLWARAHLEHLLAQGPSPRIRDEIIGMSEEFHIITPYTSLLVLESDADRERFGVKRRYEMRNGEQFFAEGRDNANYELVQAQMKQAAGWRTNLRRRTLNALRPLGRNLRTLEDQLSRIDGQSYSGGGGFGFGGMMGGMGAGGFIGGMGGGMGGMGGGSFGSGSFGEEDERHFSTFDVDDEEMGIDPLEGEHAPLFSLDPPLPEPLSLGLPMDDGNGGVDVDAFLSDGLGNGRMPYSQYPNTAMGSPYSPDFESLSDRYNHKQGGEYFSDFQWMTELFPRLYAASPQSNVALPTELWSADALAVSKSLLRGDSLSKLQGGIELKQVHDEFDVTWNRRSSRRTDLSLYSPTGWMTRSFHPGAETVVNYALNHERGAYSLSYLLGRRRTAVASDFEPTELELFDHSLIALHQIYGNYKASIEQGADNQAKLILTNPHGPDTMLVWIDTSRHVVVKRERLNDARIVSTHTYEDFVEIGGTWWARKVTERNADGATTSEDSIDIKLWPAVQFAERLNAELVATASVQFLRFPLVKLQMARQKVADGAADFDDRLAMVLHSYQRQLWDEMWSHVDALEKLVPEKKGVRWIRIFLQMYARRSEESRQRLLLEATTLAAEPHIDELYLANTLIEHELAWSSWSECLEITERLKPVYERQPAEIDGLNQWRHQLARCYAGGDNLEQLTTLWQTLAASAPWNLNWQVQYATTLSNAGRADAGLAWLRNELNRPVKRTEHEQDVLRSAMANLLYTQARWPEFLEFTTEWVKHNPTSMTTNSAYARHLSALIFNDQKDQADQLAFKWLTEGRIEGKLAPDQHARLICAINYAQGHFSHFSRNQIEERWLEPLSATVRFFLQHPHHGDIAARAFGHQFQNTEDADRLRGEFLVLLQSEQSKLTPEVIQSLVNWMNSGRTRMSVPLNGRIQFETWEMPREIWQKIAQTLKSRWIEEADKQQKHRLGEILHSVYRQYLDDEVVPFLRQRVAAEDLKFKPLNMSELFDALLVAKWTVENEQDAFARLRDLSANHGIAFTFEPADPLTVQLPALYRLVDAMLENRQKAALAAWEDQGGQDKLTRQEVSAKRIEIRRAAQSGLAARLADEARKEDGPLSNWFQMEKAWLEMQLHQDMEDVRQFCWSLLGDAPQPKIVIPDDDDEYGIDGEDPQILDPATRTRAIHQILQGRAWAMIRSLAARKSATPDDVTRVLKYMDAGIALGADDADTWRIGKYQMLVVLDLPDELERALHQWIRDDVSTARWRRFLAHLLAERSKLSEAIQLLEACEKDKLLTPADFRQLSTWYQAVDRRADHERSLAESYRQMSEEELHEIAPWQQSDVTVLDESLLAIFKVLFEKSAAPERYLDQLRSVYAGTRDFRLLQMVPDAVLGRTQEQIYPYLIGLNEQVLIEVRDEATADEILARIKALRTANRTETDLRALDLMEALVERKSSEILDQSKPHIDACLLALQRAFARNWRDHEPRMMAQFLSRLGILPEPLAAEQLRQMQELLKIVPANGRDHLWMTADLCDLQMKYGRSDEALMNMDAEVRSYRLAHEGGWPVADNDVLGRYVSWLSDTGQYASAETILQEVQATTSNAEQRKWLDEQLLSLYTRAYQNRGTVSLGTDQDLFHNIYKLVLQKIDASQTEVERHTLVERLINFFEVAHDGNRGGEPTRREFCFNVLPGILQRQTSQYSHTVTAPIRAIHDPHEALKYIVERLEQYPQRFETAWASGWDTLGNPLAERRSTVGPSDLDPRILAIVIRELQRDLRNKEYRGHAIYNRNNSQFWAVKADDFSQAAERVLTENAKSTRIVTGVANYYWSGLDRKERAIEILLIAHKQGLLGHQTQTQLIEWLQQTQRFAESIALLESLIAAYPDDLSFRKDLLLAYFKTERFQQLGELIPQTHDDFHAGGRWNESAAADLGDACLQCGELERAVQYLSEAITLHQRANSDSGLNDDILSGYYAQQATAYSDLGRTREAVDAASAALVCWGSQHEERTERLEGLKSILSSAADLDDYVTSLDAENAKTSQDSPILRKSIGLVYKERMDYEKAIAQLRLAVDLQPTDAEIHQALMECFDATENAAAATTQLLKLIDLQRSNLALYEQLADRLKDNEGESERAATSIIEASPNQAENHAAMATLRQQQDRWSEAITHWEQVAELRKLEPGGLLHLAEALLHEKRWDAARETIKKLRTTPWPAHFTDVESQASKLEDRLPARP